MKPIKIVRSIRFNLSEMAGVVAEKRFRQWQPTFPATAPEQGNWSLATVCGERNLPMLKAMLVCLIKTCSTLPKLVVIEDEPGSVRKYAEQLKAYPGSIEFTDAERVSDFFTKKGDHLIASCAGSHIFGLKIAATQMLSLAGPLLYSDTDVLWFKDPLKLIKTYQNFGLCLCEDYYRVYNPDLLSAFSSVIKPEYVQAPFGNAGVMVIPENGGLDTTSRQMLTWVVEDPDTRWGHFGNSEQTVLALCSLKNARLMEREDLFCQAFERYPIRPSWKGQPWVGRHYISPVRKQYYIDFLALLKASK